MYFADIKTVDGKQKPINERLSAAKGICKQCLLKSKCSHNLQKILDCNIKVVQYYTEIQSGFKQYPYKGNLRFQAQWFKTLYLKLDAEVKSIQEKQAEKKKGKK